jgi:RNA polymerase sigma-70 factor (ECF subfamily)
MNLRSGKNNFMEDSQIVSGLKTHDVAAFNMLFKTFFTRLQFFVFRIIDQKEDAEDITIYCFSKFWQQEAERFDSLDEIRKYLFQMAKNKALDYLKGRAVRLRHKADTLSGEPGEDPYYLERAHYQTEMIRRVHEEIEKLAPRTQEVFRMVYLQNMKRKDVAEALNISVITVHRLCSEALQKLQHRFSHREFLLILLVFNICKN